MIWNSNECECRIGNVEHVLVEIMDLRSVCDENGFAGLFNGCEIFVEVSEEGERNVVAGAE